MNTLEEFSRRAAKELGLPPDALDVTAVLDVARDVAHGVARPAAPLAAYLMGVAVGRGQPPAEAARILQRLGAEWEKHPAASPPPG